MPSPAQLLRVAATLIRSQVEAPAQIHPNPGWKRDAQIWLSHYDRWLKPEGAPVSRWRPIDSEGNVSPDPAPENPLEPDPVGGQDDGETGPPEQDMDRDFDGQHSDRRDSDG